ncbi:MAG: glycosyltransferase [bacterium]|nr:glycosyltransferase [bacterium]
MCKISVIIPTFNRAKYIVEAVRSVLSQTYSDFELIIVDDGSTDETRETLKPFLDKVKYLFQPNKGVSAARNLGISKSRGEYIAFLDSDDLWMKDKLGIQVDFMENNPRAKVTYTEEIWIRRGIRVNRRERHKKYSGWIFEHVLPLCLISPSSVMIKREVFRQIGVFDESLPACEDYDFGIRLAKRYPIFLIEKQLIIKRGGHPDQLSKKFWGMDRFRVKALEKIMDNCNLTKEEKRLVLKHMREKCQILAKGCLKRGKIDEAKRYEQIPQRYE